MATTSIAEVLDTASKMKTKKEKVEFLKKHDCLPLRNILILMYGKDKFEFNVPHEAPPYTESEHLDSQGMLYREARKLKYFVKGWGGDRIHQYKRERMFIEMLESVDKEDAKVLCRMLEQKKIKGLTASTINAAFGDIIETKKSEKDE